MDNPYGTENDRAEKRVSTAHDIAYDVVRPRVPSIIYHDVETFSNQRPLRHSSAGNEDWSRLRPLKRKSQSLEDLHRDIPTARFIPFGPGSERPFILQYPKRPSSGTFAPESSQNVYSTPPEFIPQTTPLDHMYLPHISQDEALVPLPFSRNIGHANSTALPTQMTQSMHTGDKLHAIPQEETQEGARLDIPMANPNPFALYDGKSAQHDGAGPGIHDENCLLQRNSIAQRFSGQTNQSQAVSLPQTLTTRMPLRPQQDVGNTSSSTASHLRQIAFIPRPTTSYPEFSHEDFTHRIMRNNVRGYQHNAHPCNPFHKDLNPYNLNLNDVNAALPIPPIGWIYGRKWWEVIPQYEWEPGMLGKIPAPGVFDADQGIPDSKQLAHWRLLISIDRARTGSLGSGPSQGAQHNAMQSSDTQEPYQLPRQYHVGLPKTVPAMRCRSQTESRSASRCPPKIVPALVTSLEAVGTAQIDGSGPTSSSCIRASISKEVSNVRPENNQSNVPDPSETASVVDSQPVAARTRSKQHATRRFEPLTETETHFVLYLIIHGISLEAVGQALSYYRFHSKTAADKAMRAARDKLDELKDQEALSVAQARTLTKTIAEAAIEQSWAFYLGRASTWDADEDGVNAHRGRAWQEAKQRQSLDRFRRRHSRDPKENEPGFAALQIEHDAAMEAESRGYNDNDIIGLSEYLLGGLAEYLGIDENETEI